MIKNPDTFTKNIFLVFAGTSLANFLNLLYQLLIAHKLCPADFAAFNVLLSLYALIATPIGTLQPAVVKYTAEFNARNQPEKIRVLLSKLLKATLFFALPVCIAFYFLSFYITDKLQIPSLISTYILVLMLAVCWLSPVLGGGIQGLELFKWLVFISLAAGLLKLFFAYLFISLGFNIAGALAAFLFSSVAMLLISYFPLKAYINLKDSFSSDGVNFKEIFFYMFPVATASFCFLWLVSFDMVMVRRFFTPQESGLYSLAQMAGKIFLFLPGAISIVMFPRASGLNARDIDTKSVLKKSLFYGCILCIGAVLFYNLFPFFVLKVLTGKLYPESIFLGRLFSISMSFFALLYTLIFYFLSINDLRFIKYLVSFSILQFLAILLFHRTLTQVQLILCVSAGLLFLIHLILAFKKK